MCSKLLSIILAAFFASCVLCAGSACAWDVFYDGSVFPNSPTLGSAAWSDYSQNFLRQTSAANGLLHLVDQRSDKTVRFYREGAGLPKGCNVTIEARVKVASAASPYSWDYGVGFGATTSRSGAFVGLWPDKIGTRYDSENYLQFYTVDMTQFHTLRMAVNGNTQTFVVWLDGAQVFSGSNPGGYPGGVYFGTSSYPNGTADATWDYVAYTLPEPSSLLGLLAGLGGLGAMLRRRRRG